MTTVFFFSLNIYFFFFHQIYIFLFFYFIFFFGIITFKVTVKLIKICSKNLKINYIPILEVIKILILNFFFLTKFFFKIVILNKKNIQYNKVHFFINKRIINNIE